MIAICAPRLAREDRHDRNMCASLGSRGPAMCTIALVDGAAPTGRWVMCTWHTAEGQQHFLSMGLGQRIFAESYVL